jgi:exodeoxyribonuclease V alpha subunit
MSVDQGPATGFPAAGPEPDAQADPYRPELALGPDLPDLLRVFNRAGVLAPADVHAAVRLARLAGETDPQVVLAAALAVRGPRVGHVSVDLNEVRASAVVGEDDVDLDGLPWPEVDGWTARVAGSAMVGPAGDDAGGEVVPLRLAGCHLYLDRYWRDEVALAADLNRRAARPPGPDRSWAAPPTAPYRPGPAPSGPPPGPAELERLFPGPGSTDQRRAAADALTRHLTVLAGGPGTGKTTTVARLLALLCERALAAARRMPLIALAAPTGKAAARMEEAVRAETAVLDSPSPVGQVLGRLSGTTIHRLLGTRPDRPGQFRHHRTHLLPHDVVVVDEASMVSLPLMARLVEAVRPDAYLILVGDPEQLVSVEAGAVLADIVGRSADRPATGTPSGPSARAAAVAGSISVLRTNHRFSGALAQLSEAVRAGDGDGTLSVLAAGHPAVEWHDVEPTGLLAGSSEVIPESGALGRLAAASVGWAQAVRDAAVAGDGAGALAALRSHRVLCAHRRGPTGVARCNRIIETWLDPALGDGPWYPGRPVLITANDYAQRLYNGDTGVTVLAPEDPDDPAVGQVDGRRQRGPISLRVAFEAGPAERGRMVSPSRLDSVETVYAMTVHKSQGSEFDQVTLLLPPASSRLLTRELLYTALTRARHRVLVIGTAAAVTRAVERPAARASGLGGRLWGSSGADGVG